MAGTLYLVATPIGNLQDVTHRALEVLRTVDLIACEDTRHTLKLLNHFRISNRLISYHEHNELERAEELADRLVAGASIAIVSDAGTPGICDPAFRIVQRAIEVGATVVPIPGAVAFINAVIASGISTDSIFFGGFLPSKKGDRRKRLEEIRDIPATLVLYETPHRIAKSLVDCFEVLGDRRAAVARELTKLHEETARGRLSELAERYGKESVKGEIVLVIERAALVEPKRETPTPRSISKRVKELEKEGVDGKTALKKAAKEFGLSKSEAYRFLELSK
ncbi:MAG TPA: 16S rRNA (cytidine(1402)-2'-O)-methyltransferase [Pyrinomonadaceae bacterium]|nr:16S rRNA (cytidine(1402)-2'-O)-methyltransferase [Pyrinomonadaceae bacterium]